MELTDHQKKKVEQKCCEGFRNSWLRAVELKEVKLICCILNLSSSARWTLVSDLEVQRGIKLGKKGCMSYESLEDNDMNLIYESKFLPS